MCVFMPPSASTFCSLSPATHLEWRPNGRAAVCTADTIHDGTLTNMVVRPRRIFGMFGMYVGLADAGMVAVDVHNCDARGRAVRGGEKPGSEAHAGRVSAVNLDETGVPSVPKPPGGLP